MGDEMVESLREIAAECSDDGLVHTAQAVVRAAVEIERLQAEADVMARRCAQLERVIQLDTAYAQGIASERVRIVAWLRQRADLKASGEQAYRIDVLADAIEAAGGDDA